MHEVKKFFKPEFLNRLDDIIVFHYLEEEQVLQIAHKFVNELLQNIKQRDITLDIEEAVYQKLAHDGFDPVYGARPLRREIERQLENPLSMKLIKGECTDGSHLHIKIENNQITFS